MKKNDYNTTLYKLVSDIKCDDILKIISYKLNIKLNIKRLSPLIKELNTFIEDIPIREKDDLFPMNPIREGLSGRVYSQWNCIYLRDIRQRQYHPRRIDDIHRVSLTPEL